MGAFRFYSRVLALAFSHSLEKAHVATYAVVLALGLIVGGWPGAREMLGLTEWQIGFFCLAAVVLGRLLMAPYWAYQEVITQLPTRGSEQDKANTSLEIARNYLLDHSAWAARTAHLDYLNQAPLARKTLIHSITNTHEIPAWGLLKESQFFERIPTTYWDTFTIDPISFDNPPYGAVTVIKSSGGTRNGADVIIYHNVRVDRADLLRVWPRASFADNWYAVRQINARRRARTL